MTLQIETWFIITVSLYLDWCKTASLSKAKHSLYRPCYQDLLLILGVLVAPVYTVKCIIYISNVECTKYNFSVFIILWKPIQILATYKNPTIGPGGPVCPSGPFNPGSPCKKHTHKISMCMVFKVNFSFLILCHLWIKIQFCIHIHTAGPGMPRNPSGPDLPGCPWGPTGPVFPTDPGGPLVPYRARRQMQEQGINSKIDQKRILQRDHCFLSLP